MQNNVYSDMFSQTCKNCFYMSGQNMKFFTIIMYKNFEAIWYHQLIHLHTSDIDYR